MKRGKFIVLEGIDASGKTTQYNLLKKNFQRKKIRYITADFPRYYKSKWGILVGRYLGGEFGGLDEVDPHLAVLPYIIDQYTWSRDVGTTWINRGGWILSNRYFTSNVHQISKIRSAKRRKFRNWIWPLGYKELGMLRPDLVIFIDTPPAVAMKLNKAKQNRTYLKGKKADLAEKSKKHQVASYNEYLYTVRNNRSWKRVRCLTKGNLDSPQEIQKRVWKQVEKLMK